MTRGNGASGPKGTRQVFTAAFKLEAVARWREREAVGASRAEVARELGIRSDMLKTWAGQVDARAGAAPRDVFPGQGQLPSDQAELRRLQRENSRLQQENEFLKKAAAYFATGSR
jgi:transposase